MWIYPQQKYHQVTYACYDASQPENFYLIDKNWGPFTTLECETIISLSEQIDSELPVVDQKFQPELRLVNLWSLNYLESTKWLW